MERFTAGGQGPTSGCSAVEEEEECTINTQNLNKNVGAIFEKIEMLNFFLCELPLILGIWRKLKKNGTRYL